MPCGSRSPAITRCHHALGSTVDRLGRFFCFTACPAQTSALAHEPSQPVLSCAIERAYVDKGYRGHKTILNAVDTYLVSHARVLKTISLYSAFVFVHWAHSARRWRIDRLAKHRRCIVVVQANPTGTAAAAATSTSAGPHGQPCVRLLNAGSRLLVEDVECRKADIGDLFFTQHHSLADKRRIGRIWVHATNCGGRAARQRE